MNSLRQKFPREYSVWANMKYRCNNSKCKVYPAYGGRGIKVCTKWNSFSSFFKDMGPRPSNRHTLERLDNDLGYGPDNCKWATYTEQGNNRRGNRAITFEGKTMNLAQWAESLGISKELLYSRLNVLGWELEQALTTPAQAAGTGKHVKHYIYKGESLTLTQWSEKLGVSKKTLSNRLSQCGWSVEKTLSTLTSPRSSR